MFTWLDLVWPIGITLLIFIICIIAVAKEAKNAKRVGVFVSCIGLMVVSVAGAGVYYYMRWKALPYKDCYHNNFANITHLNVKPNLKTPKGIKVDNSSGQEIDLDKIDSRIDSMEMCFKDIVKDKLVLTDQQARDADCYRREFKLEDVTIKRNCLTLKIVKPVSSKCSDWQFIGVKADSDKGCLDKGLKPTPECPCQWRVAIQDQNVLVTPPALYLWDIGRMVTSCNNVWKTPFTPCLMK